LLSGDILSLLFTNKQLSHEAREVLYGCNDLAFRFAMDIACGNIFTWLHVIGRANFMLLTSLSIIVTNPKMPAYVEDFMCVALAQVTNTIDGTKTHLKRLTLESTSEVVLQDKEYMRLGHPVDFRYPSQLHKEVLQSSHPLRQTRHQQASKGNNPNHFFRMHLVEHLLNIRGLQELRLVGPIEVKLQRMLYEVMQFGGDFMSELPEFFHSCELARVRHEADERELEEYGQLTSLRPHSVLGDVGSDTGTSQKCKDLNHGRPLPTSAKDRIRLALNLSDYARNLSTHCKEIAFRRDYYLQKMAFFKSMEIPSFTFNFEDTSNGRFELQWAKRRSCEQGAVEDSEEDDANDF
jgi:hypothetical protein